jgi:hypothetical protein
MTYLGFRLFGQIIIEIDKYQDNIEKDLSGGKITRNCLIATKELLMPLHEKGIL